VKQSLADVARLVSRMRIFGKVIKGLRDFAEVKINFQLGTFATDNEMQQFPGFVLTQPIIDPPGRVSAIPFQNKVSGLQSGFRCRAVGIYSANDERPFGSALGDETEPCVLARSLA
jgi:hypothetical protein